MKRFTRQEFERRLSYTLTLENGVSFDVTKDLRLIVQRGSVRVIVWPDNTVTRGDVRLDLAKKMTFREAAKLLKLERDPKCLSR